VSKFHVAGKVALDRAAIARVAVVESLVSRGATTSKGTGIIVRGVA
jgi:hypothetical protein